jgi:hypothetical protein
MTFKRFGIVGGLLVAAVIATVVSMASCAQTPPNVTVRTFKQAQKVDVVCLKVDDPNAGAVPVAQGQCVPVPLNANGAGLPFHLYAVVTQTTQGALAVVDLTAGNVVDVDRATPGIDFIPVGANPTDVVVGPGGQRTFVASADPNKMAIYAIDNTQLLGDSFGTSQPPRLTGILSCALPQPPQALAVVPMGGPDAGASGGSDAGATGSYALVAMLRAFAGMPAAIATIDATSMAKGSLSPCTVLGVTALSPAVPPTTPSPYWSDGVPFADAGDLHAPQCPLSSAGEGGSDAALVDGAPPGRANAGDAGRPPQPVHPTSMALRNDLPILYVADDAVPLIHVIDLRDPTGPKELEPLVATSIDDPTRRVGVGGIAISPTTRDYKTYLYAIDARQGTLIVYDVTDPAASPHSPLRRPHPELNPFAPPDRIAFSAPVAAIAFAQHDWSLPAAAFAGASQSPDTIHQYTGLLCNPNPNAHPDGGAFVDRGAYYRADWAGLIQSSVTLGGTVQGFPARLRGVFAFATLSNGNVITVDVDDWDAPCRRPDPMAIGTVTDPLGQTYNGGVTGVLDIPEPAPTGPDDLNPYHAPLAYNGAIPERAAVTLEAFFPVSAPHRLRSGFLLRNDPTALRIPNVVSVPQLFSATGAAAVMASGGAATSPLMLPTPLPPGFIDPTYIQNPTEPNPNARAFSATGSQSMGAVGSAIPFPLPSESTSANAPAVRLSFDDPTAHVDQDWIVSYEGALPTVGGIAAHIGSTQPLADPGAYETLTFSAPGAGFCARGIEDWSIGQTRANRVLAAITTSFPTPPPALPTGLTPSPSLPQWTSDYVEINDDLLPPDDRYWTEPSQLPDGSDGNECWDGALRNDNDPKVANNRYDACLQTFGAAADADTHLARDLPILRARDDSLEVGRFAWYPTDPNMPGKVIPEQTTNRVIVSADPGNKPFLRLARCCFHHQATFRVRAGGEWVAVGLNSLGLLHHGRADASGACVPSCDPRDTLLNSRAFDIPWGSWSEVNKRCNPVPPPTFDRDSPLAMRNPMFSFVMWSACGEPPGYGDHTLATRDLTWKFSVRGGFAPLTVSLTAQSSSTAVSPQSMHYISSLGQLAIVDGEAQGLVLIDLNLVSVIHSYF